MLGHGPIGSRPLGSLNIRRVQLGEDTVGVEDSQIQAYLKAWVEKDAFGRAEVVQIPPPRPPREAQLLLHYVLPRALRVEALGDLEEDYQQEWLPKFGPHHARRMYWRHALRSITPMLWMAMKRWGIITLILGVADWLRDRLG